MLPIEAPTMTPSPFRTSPGDVWAELYLTALPTAVARARRFTEVTLHRWRLAACCDAVSLVASELLTNSVRATGPDTMPQTLDKLDDLDLAVVAVRLRSTPSSLFVEVWDSDPEPPMLTEADALDESGRGLTLVAALTTTWGHYACEGTTPGKVVWAEIARSADWAP